MLHVKLDELINLFLSDQYEKVIDHHVADEQYDFHRLQLVLISLVRLGRADLALHVASTLLSDWSGGLWERDLLRISIADFKEPLSILRRAHTPEQKSQSYYYLGELFLTSGEEEMAQKAFRCAFDSPADCLEIRLSKARLLNMGAEGATFDRAELRCRVAKIIREGKRLADSKQHADSVATLTNLLSLAASNFGPGSVEVGTIHRQLGETWLSWERWAQARDEFERALAILRPYLDDEPDQITSLMNNLGVAYQKLRDFDAARPLHWAVVEHRESTLGLDHADTVLSLDNLAYLEQEAGQLAESRRLAREVLRRRRRSAGEWDSDTLESMRNLAAVMELEGDMDSAAALREEVSGLEAWESRGHTPKAADERSLRLAELAKKSLEQGNYHDAQSWYEQALESRRLACPEDDAGTAALISNLGYAYWSQSKDGPAERFSREALELRRRLLPSDHPDIALSCNNLAQVLQTQGDFAEVEVLMLEALRIDRAAFGAEGDAVAGDLNNLALLYANTGRPAEARRYYRLAVDLWRLRYPGGHPHLLTAVHNLSNLMLKLNNQDEVFEVVESEVALAEKLLGNDHPELIPHLGQMATFHRLRGHFDEAARVLDRAVTIGRKRLPPGHRWLVDMQNDVGLLHASRGNHAAAVKIYSELWDQKTNVSSQGINGRIASNIAWSYGCLGDFDRASQWASHAISIQKHINNPLPLSQSWGKLGLAEAASGRTLGALKALLESAQLFDKAFDQTVDGSTDRQRNDMLEFGREQWDMILSLLTTSLIDDQSCVRAVTDFVLRRKGLSAALLEMHTSHIQESKHPEARVLAEELRALRANIARESQADAPGLGNPASVRIRQQRARLLEEKLVAILPSLAGRCAESTVTHEQLAAALPEGAALVEFVHFKVFDFRDWHSSRTAAEALFGQHRYLAIIIQRGSSRVCALDLGVDETIDRLVIRWRIEMTGDVPLDRGLGALVASALATDVPEDAASALREAVLDPILAELHGEKRLILAPDGKLALVPIAALPMPNGQLLMDEFELTHVLAGRDVLKFRRLTHDTFGDSVVVADPDFLLRDPDHELPEQVMRALDGAPRHPINPLPGTRAEAEAIGPLLGVAPWLGADALKSRVLAVRSPRVLHLATHGYLQAGAGIDARLYVAMCQAPSDADPLLASGLLLAGAGWKAGRFQPPQDAGDGVLTALEAATMDLRGTHLVVLSACETGLGIQRRSDGFLGLRRSFFIAGARTLVSSLWKVPDMATAELMGLFYARLMSGDGCGIALAGAQTEMRLRYPRKPIVWAAFICYGDSSCVLT